jgi:hypothetical protein
MRLLSEITKHILATEQAAAWGVLCRYAAVPSGCRLRSREKSSVLPGYQKSKSGSKLAKGTTLLFPCSNLLYLLATTPTGL